MTGHVSHPNPQMTCRCICPVSHDPENKGHHHEMNLMSNYKEMKMSTVTDLSNRNASVTTHVVLCSFSPLIRLIQSNHLLQGQLGGVLV